MSSTNERISKEESEFKEAEESLKSAEFLGEDELGRQKILKQLLFGDSDFIGPSFQRDYKLQEYVSGILGKLFEVKDDISGYYKELEQYKDHYIVQLIIEVLTDEILTEGIEGVMLDVSFEQKDKDNNLITEELKNFFTEFDVPALLEEIIFDLLLYGDYSLELETEAGKGITKIKDSVAPGTIIPLYESKIPKMFWKVEKGKTKTTYEIHKYVNFNLTGRKIRLKVEGDNPLGRDFCPMFRVGKSVIWSSLSKIKDLDLMEKAFSLNLFNTLTSSNIVALSLPQSFSIKEMMEATKKYEDLLNSHVSDSISQKDISSIDNLSKLLETSRKIKVIPSFSDKGSLSNINNDTQSNNKLDILDDIRDARDAISATSSIPSDLMFGTGESRRTALKQYARYARKVKSIKRCISFGLKQLCLNHLAFKFQEKDYLLSSIKINTHNNITIDDLDNLEGIDLVLDSINEVMTLAENLTSSELEISEYVDKRELVSHIRNSLKSAGFTSYSIIKDPYEDEESELDDPDLLPDLPRKDDPEEEEIVTDPPSKDSEDEEI